MVTTTVDNATGQRAAMNDRAVFGLIDAYAERPEPLGHGFNTVTFLHAQFTDAGERGLTTGRCGRRE